jgi:hypothetical protein
MKPAAGWVVRLVEGLVAMVLRAYPGRFRDRFEREILGLVHDVLIQAWGFKRGDGSRSRQKSQVAATMRSS